MNWGRRKYIIKILDLNFVEEIRNFILSSFGCVRFSFTLRSDNTLAHSLVHNFNIDAKGVPPAHILI